uniref:Uncharacterized protein n=1 Tax=Romanomermis culicivorax TaxID=13658 RepID=A0A915KBW8_ROMCU
MTGSTTVIIAMQPTLVQIVTDSQEVDARNRLVEPYCRCIKHLTIKRTPKKGQPVNPTSASGRTFQSIRI